MPAALASESVLCLLSGHNGKLTEEELLDEKSNGLQLERSEIRSVPAPSRFCLVLAVTTLLLSVQGQQVVTSGKRRWVDVHWERGNSYFWIGWNWLKGCLHKDWALFPSIELQGGYDPAPRLHPRSKLNSNLNGSLQSSLTDWSPEICQSTRVLTLSVASSSGEIELRFPDFATFPFLQNG